MKVDGNYFLKYLLCGIAVVILLGSCSIFGDIDEIRDEVRIGQTFTVTFNCMGGNFAGMGGIEVLSQSVRYGQKTERPSEAPVKDSLFFADWFKDSACTKRWYFASDTVTGDITL